MLYVHKEKYVLLASCGIKLHYNFPYFPAHLTFISERQSQLFNSGNPNEDLTQSRAWRNNVRA